MPGPSRCMEPALLRQDLCKSHVHLPPLLSLPVLSFPYLFSSSSHLFLSPLLAPCPKATGGHSDLCPGRRREVPISFAWLWPGLDGPRSSSGSSLLQGKELGMDRSIPPSHLKSLLRGILGTQNNVNVPFAISRDKPGLVTVAHFRHVSQCNMKLMRASLMTGSPPEF